MPAEINGIFCELAVIGMGVMWGVMLIGAGMAELWRSWAKR